MNYSLATKMRGQMATANAPTGYAAELVAESAGASTAAPKRPLTRSLNQQFLQGGCEEAAA